jgi:hypothetical protein
MSVLDIGQRWPKKFRLRPRWDRKVHSSPDDAPCSPVDSGYGSLPSSPVRTEQFAESPVRPRQQHELAEIPAKAAYDFNGSLGIADDDFDTHLMHQRPVPAAKYATLPRAAIRHRPNLPPAFHSFTTPRSEEAAQDKGRRRLSGGSLRAPDRFVPHRGHSTDIAEVFKTNKSGHELSAAERILRRNEATPDAFAYSRRAATPTASEVRQMSRSDSAVGRRARFVTATGTVLNTLPNRNQGQTERRVRAFPHITIKSIFGTS